MLALIIISGIVVYIIMAIVTYHLWLAFIESRCRSCISERNHKDDAYWYRCNTDHEFGALWMAGLWPVLPVLTGVGYVLYLVAEAISTMVQTWAVDFFKKEDK